VLITDDTVCDIFLINASYTLLTFLILPNTNPPPVPPFPRVSRSTPSHRWSFVLHYYVTYYLKPIVCGSIKRRSRRSSGVTGTWYRSKLFQLEIYGIPYMKKSRNSVKFRGISRNYSSRNSAEFRRNFSPFRTEYGIDGSKKNRRNSVSTEFRGHPTHNSFLYKNKMEVGDHVDIIIV